MSTFLLIISCLCVGYIAGSIVERKWGKNASIVKGIDYLRNPNNYSPEHFTGNLKNCGMTQTEKDEEKENVLY